MPATVDLAFGLFPDAAFGGVGAETDVFRFAGFFRSAHGVRGCAIVAIVA